jgi:DNA-directed RNA polymerase specialized sigma24 family protein
MMRARYYRRQEIKGAPALFAKFSEGRGLWHESPEEVQRLLAWGRRKAKLIRWVRRRLRRDLTPREAQCIRLYYLRGKSLIQIAALTGTTRSSVKRAIDRGIQRLRASATRCRSLQPEPEEEAAE